MGRPHVLCGTVDEDLGVRQKPYVDILMGGGAAHRELQIPVDWLSAMLDRNIHESGLLPRYKNG